MVDLNDIFGELAGIMGDFGFYDGELIYYVLYNGIKVLCFLVPFIVVYWVVKFVSGAFYK